jgi:hypothetical protein
VVRLRGRALGAVSASGPYPRRRIRSAAAEVFILACGSRVGGERRATSIAVEPQLRGGAAGKGGALGPTLVFTICCVPYLPHGCRTS